MVDLPGETRFVVTRDGYRWCVMAESRSLPHNGNCELCSSIVPKWESRVTLPQFNVVVRFEQIAIRRLRLLAPTTSNG